MRTFASLALLVLASSSYAQATRITEGPKVEDVMFARGYAMGGAFRAIGGGSDAILGNPASMGILRTYRVELGGGWDPRRPFGYGSLSILDSITSQVAAGINYQFVSLGADAAQRVAHVNTVAVSVPIGQVFALGGSSRHVLMTGAREANALTADAGMLLRLGTFNLGFTGYNLVDIRNPDFLRSYALAAGLVLPGFSLAADVRGDFNGPKAAFAYHGGAEYLLGDFLPIRAGYAHDDITGTRSVGAGLGLVLESTQIDLSYRHELGGERARVLGLTLVMRVQ